jgi:hypothetical protein
LNVSISGIDAECFSSNVFVELLRWLLRIILNLLPRSLE